MKETRNTLGWLIAMRQKQIEEGACSGDMYVGGNANHGARFEKCAHRDECELYKAYTEMRWHYGVLDYMHTLSPRIWRKCEPIRNKPINEKEKP